MIANPGWKPHTDSVNQYVHDAAADLDGETRPLRRENTQTHKEEAVHAQGRSRTRTRKKPYTR